MKKHILIKVAALLLVASMLAGCDGNVVIPLQTHAEETTSEAIQVPVIDEPENTTVTTEPQYESCDLELKLSKESGIYADAFGLEMSCDGAETIYYTTDGSDPRTSDSRIVYESSVKIESRAGDKNVVSSVDPILYSATFMTENSDGTFTANVEPPSDDAVDKCTVIRACGVNGDGAYTAPVSGTYFIGTAEEHIKGLNESCTAAGRDLAVISISMDYNDLFDENTGIYVKGKIFDIALASQQDAGNYVSAEDTRKYPANYNQRGREWERAAHIDFLETGVDGAESVLSQDCGIRIQGNYSRSDLQKGFRLYARSDYGENNFNYAVFGDSLTDINGVTIDKFKTLILRNGGNCAFTSKFNDTYWQALCADMDVETQASRPCVVYLNGEYWGLYVLEEDYTDDYFEDHYGVDKNNVVIYKGDAETYECGYKLDEGTLPDGVTDEGYFYKELNEFFKTHTSCESAEDYEELTALVDPESVSDYFAAEIWINNKWDWPGKNWSMWRVTSDDGSEYGDGRWRFCFYDMEFGGVSGEPDAYTNTIKEDNYKRYGLLDTDTKNVAVLCYAYLMTNEGFRKDFCDKLSGLSSANFEKTHAIEVLDNFINVYGPLFDQFFERYPATGSPDEAIHGGYASADCIRGFLNKREKYVKSMVTWVGKILG